MKIFINVLCVVAFIVSKACYANDVSEQTFDVLLTIDQEDRYDSSGNFVYLYSNDKGDVVWAFNNNILHQGIRDCYYSNTSLNGEKVYLTKIITDALMQLGFVPTWSKILEESSFKQVWGSEYFANYNIHPIHGGWGGTNPKCMDDFGNILLTFSHDGPKDLFKQNPTKLCVWHKERGFKFLPIPGIESVKRVYLECDQLIVVGLDETLAIERFVVLSMAKGFWGEREQEIVIPEPDPIEEENPGSWWDWWPKT